MTPSLVKVRQREGLPASTLCTVRVLRRPYRPAKVRQAALRVDHKEPLSLRSRRHAIVWSDELVRRVGGGTVLFGHRVHQIRVGRADQGFEPAEERRQARERHRERATLCAKLLMQLRRMRRLSTP